MCHDYDSYLAKARIAEQLRKEKAAAQDKTKPHDATPSQAPREPQEREKVREPAAV